MAFKKIDADAVNSNEPLDAFVIQGVDANLDAARSNRLRRASIGWPVDLLPIVAAHKTVAYPLARWPVIPGVTEVTIVVRHTIADASVNMALAKVGRNGRLDKTDEDLTAVGTGTDTMTTLTCDVTAFQGDVVDLFLLVKSDIATSPAQQTATIAGGTDGNVIKNPQKVHLPSGHGITLFGNTDDRWVLYFDDAVSGSNYTDGDEFPGPRTIIKMLDSAGDTELWVWPRFTEGDYEDGLNWTTGNYKVVVDTLGRSTIKGISIYDSAVDAFAPAQGKQVPGLPPVAGAIQELYTRGRQIHQQHTRVFHAGPTYDRSRQDADSNVVTAWGEFAEYSSSAWQVHGACWLGTYARNNIDGGSSRYRNRVKVAGFVSILNTLETNRPFVSVQFRASIYSYSGGAWTGSATNGTAVTQEVPIGIWGGNYAGQETTESAMLFSFGERGISGQNWHYLRGAVGANDLNRTGAELTPFEVEVEDAQTTATDRMLRLEIQGVTATGDVVGWTAYPAIVHVTGLTVWEAPGAQGT